MPNPKEIPQETKDYFNGLPDKEVRELLLERLNGLLLKDALKRRDGGDGK